jgi:hypothetical protein
MDDSEKGDCSGNSVTRLRQTVSRTRSDRLKGLLDVISAANVQQRQMTREMKSYLSKDKNGVVVKEAGNMHSVKVKSSVFEKNKSSLTPRRMKLFQEKLKTVTEDENEGNVFETAGSNNNTLNKRNG